MPPLALLLLLVFDEVRLFDFLLYPPLLLPFLLRLVGAFFFFVFVVVAFFDFAATVFVVFVAEEVDDDCENNRCPFTPAPDPPIISFRCVESATYGLPPTITPSSSSFS